MSIKNTNLCLRLGWVHFILTNRFRSGCLFFGTIGLKHRYFASRIVTDFWDRRYFLYLSSARYSTSIGSAFSRSSRVVSRRSRSSFKVMTSMLLPFSISAFTYSPREQRRRFPSSSTEAKVAKISTLDALRTYSPPAACRRGSTFP